MDYQEFQKLLQEKDKEIAALKDEVRLAELQGYIDFVNATGAFEENHNEKLAEYIELMTNRIALEEGEAAAEVFRNEYLPEIRMEDELRKLNQDELEQREDKEITVSREPEQSKDQRIAELEAQLEKAQIDVRRAELAGEIRDAHASGDTEKLQNLHRQYRQLGIEIKPEEKLFEYERYQEAKQFLKDNHAELIKEFKLRANEEHYTRLYETEKGFFYWETEDKSNPTEYSLKMAESEEDIEDCRIWAAEKQQEVEHKELLKEYLAHSQELNPNRQHKQIDRGIQKDDCPF